MIAFELPQKMLHPNDRLASLLPSFWAQPLKLNDIETVEDLYDLMDALGASWYKRITGLNVESAQFILDWLRQWGGDIGEIPARFYPSNALIDLSVTEETSHDIVPIESIEIPQTMNGEHGINRAPEIACSLSATNDLEAIRLWLDARAGNPNTYSNYRKEAERFLLWCLVEQKKALSDIKTGEASQYLRWLESLGRESEERWSQKWQTPQSRWIGPKNAPRMSPLWRPFNGPLQSASRRNALVVVRQLFNFLKKTGYLIFNPFDQVSPKVPLLPGEGAPNAFADRSLTEQQWQEIVGGIDDLPEGWPQARMRLILMLGKSLGMRASEMINAKREWIVSRRIGFQERQAIEIMGKGSKVRRLPLNGEQIAILEAAFVARGFSSLEATPATAPFLVNLGRGPAGVQAMSRSGLYRALESYFEKVAFKIELVRPMDAAKLRASSTHWLRHTFAIRALEKMSVNVVQHAMGHASVATTGRYLNPEDEEIAKAMKDMKAL